MHYHAANGTALVNYGRFPSFKSMTDHAHSLGLTSGWYGNNCICSDHCRNATECDLQIKADVASLREYNFDSWKLDGCGIDYFVMTSMRTPHIQCIRDGTYAFLGTVLA